MEHRCVDSCTPDTCIKQKLRYWRESGMSTPRVGGLNGTRKDFHDLPSVAQRERNHVRELRAAGVDFDRA
jgi:hypothetical protein